MSRPRDALGAAAQACRRALTWSLATGLLLMAAARAEAADIGVALAHPLFHQPSTCIEHWEGNLQGTGDALGSDCVVERLVEENGRAWMRMHAGDGRRNEDWFGWNEDVLSPCDCVVVRVRENRVANEPGVMGSAPSSIIVLQRSDGVHFLLAHVQAIAVKPGQRVAAGEVLGRVGNNGMSRHPHIHIGAWKDDVPLQVRFDLRALGRLLEK